MHALSPRATKTFSMITIHNWSVYVAAHCLSLLSVFEDNLHGKSHMHQPQRHTVPEMMGKMFQCQIVQGQGVTLHNLVKHKHVSQQLVVHSRNKFCWFDSDVVWDLLCQGLAFIHHKYLFKLSGMLLTTYRKPLAMFQAAIMQ